MDKQWRKRRISGFSTGCCLNATGCFRCPGACVRENLSPTYCMQWSWTLLTVDHSVVAIGLRCDVEGSQYKFVGRPGGGLSDECKFSVWKLFPDFEILGSNGEIPKPEHVAAGGRYMSDPFPGDFVHVQIASSRRKRAAGAQRQRVCESEQEQGSYRDEAAPGLSPSDYRHATGAPLRRAVRRRPR